MLDTILLSPELSRNYVLNGRYTFRVGFGKEVKRLRADRSQTDIAATALGAKASETEIRDLANYLSRIERDRVPNVGLGKIRLLAKGLNFPNLAEFFAAIEAGSRSSLLPTTHVIADNPPHTQSEADDGPELRRELDAATLASSVIGAAEVVSARLDGLATLIERLVDHVVSRDRQTASPRAGAARRRPHGAPRSRKTA